MTAAPATPTAAAMAEAMPVVAGTCVPHLREQLLALFGSELGTYTLPSGATVPAIYVVGRHQVPSDWRVSGIECILNNPPVLLDMGGVGMLAANRIWTLQFRCYDTSKDLDAIQLLAFRAWPKARPRHLPQTDNTYEQLTYELSDPVLITPL